MHFKNSNKLFTFFLQFQEHLLTPLSACLSFYCLNGYYIKDIVDYKLLISVINFLLGLVFMYLFFVHYRKSSVVRKEKKVSKKGEKWQFLSNQQKIPAFGRCHFKFLFNFQKHYLVFWLLLTEIFLTVGFFGTLLNVFWFYL